jgi:nicotinamide mononucleotide transporter
VLLLVIVSGELLTRYSNAALPFLDSLTTWGAVVATFMVTRKILENWIYWFVIDAVSIALYISRDLFFTAALFTAYLVMIVIGYRSWRASMMESNG